MAYDKKYYDDRRNKIRQKQQIRVQRLMDMIFSFVDESRDVQIDLRELDQREAESRKVEKPAPIDAKTGKPKKDKKV